MVCPPVTEKTTGKLRFWFRYQKFWGLNHLENEAHSLKGTGAYDIFVVDELQDFEMKTHSLMLTYWISAVAKNNTRYSHSTNYNSDDSYCSIKIVSSAENLYYSGIPISKIIFRLELHCKTERRSWFKKMIKDVPTYRNSILRYVIRSPNRQCYELF